MSEVRNNGRKILIDIIEDFNPEKFVRFFREKNRSFAPRKEELLQYDDGNFKNGIKLGEIQFAQDEKMLVCAFEAGQPLSERSGKKAQYEKGKKILKDSQSDAGIFIFYTPQGNFRFSLIYANYLGKKRDWSVFRRFTYFVSPSETNKTFLKQIGEEDFSSLEKIKEAFSVEKVTKDFFTDIANWYFWVVRKAEFPEDAEAEENGRNIAVIRMITRLIFIWFMKERGLIRQNLFNYKNISTLLKDLSPKNTTYYKAILQNLFFATLNTKTEDRKFRFGKSFQGKNKDYMDHGIYRYEDYYKNKEDMLVVFKDIPFLNGGLFDCLDRRTTDNGKNVEIRIDGFTDKEVGLSVPNQLFFSDEITVDLNKDYGTKNKKYKVRGLMEILSSYNFTIDENDPNDADVALDPELLGKVFENLLASFNPETATTARKQTGSFYTPREIVNYMVDESLMAYLATRLSSPPLQGGVTAMPAGRQEGQGGFIGQPPRQTSSATPPYQGGELIDARVRQLFAHTDEPHQFNPKEVDVLINAIDSAKILDPACGSGAFPMGILHKLVYALGKLDTDNSKWRELQKQKAIKETEEAFNIGNKEERIKRLFDIDDAFENNSSDYGRKLYLIENCIFGVDIQPIAVQIAKLRFFISLLVDQNVTPPSPPLNKGGMGGVNINIRPLPNLETKFVAANTLIGIERPAQGLLRNPEIDRKEAELHRVRERHFTARTPKIKQQCIEGDKKIRAEISDLLKKDGFPAGITEKLANWNPYDQNASADFFDPEWMFGLEVKEGFDVVIGNPPYGLSFSSDEKVLLRKLFPETQFKIDSYSLFILKTLSLLRKYGTCSYIIPNTFLDNYFEEKVRARLLKELTIVEICDLSDKIFESAVVHSMILTFRNIKSANYDIKISIDDQLSGRRELVPNLYFLQQDYCSINIRNYSANDLLEKLNVNSVPLEKLLDIRQAIKTGNDNKYLLNSPKKKNCKPILRGKDIQKWKKKVPNLYVDYGHHLACPRDISIFEQPKILIREAGSEITATIDEENYYIMSSLYNCILIDKRYSLKYLLSLLNSKIFQYLMNKLTFEKTKGAFTKARIFHYYKLPVKILSQNEQTSFITLVDQILTAKKQPPSSPFPKGELQVADTSALEKQIDDMVYELYGLTPEEIAIVEGKSKRQ